MAAPLCRSFPRRAATSSLIKRLTVELISPRLILHNPVRLAHIMYRSGLYFANSFQTSFWAFRSFSCGSVNLVISQGKPKFEVHEVDPPKKEKWKTKKRFKLQKRREKQKRKAASKRDPRRLTVNGKKKQQQFASADEKLKYKLEKARIKEALLVERLKRYEVPQLQGPMVQPCEITGEEQFYFKKMAQKGSNYVPVGRRGIFGGVILNMHMHWKKHETVKVFCKPCKPGQIQGYAQEIARLSGGIPIQIIGDDTIIFYRGKNYVQPEVMSPIDTLSKKKALEKSKYEQSLETVRHFIAVCEKELELYYRHIALYGDLKNKNVNDVSSLDNSSSVRKHADGHQTSDCENSISGCDSSGISQVESDYTVLEDNLTEHDDSTSELDSDDEECISGDYFDTGTEEAEGSSSFLKENP